MQRTEQERTRGSEHRRNLPGRPPPGAAMQQNGSGREGAGDAAAAPHSQRAEGLNQEERERFLARPCPFPDSGANPPRPELGGSQMVRFQGHVGSGGIRVHEADPRQGEAESATFFLVVHFGYAGTKPLPEADERNRMSILCRVRGKLLSENAAGFATDEGMVCYGYLRRRLRTGGDGRRKWRWMVAVTKIARPAEEERTNRPTLYARLSGGGLAQGETHRRTNAHA